MHLHSVLAAQRPGIYCIGTTRGTIRYEPADAPRPVRYFAGQRWLPADRVTGIRRFCAGLLMPDLHCDIKIVQQSP